MYGRICQSAAEVAMVCFELRDAHLDFRIHGVKIYKHAIFKDFPYDLNHGSCEVEQLARLREAGYRYETVPQVLGDHAPRWSKPLIFERYLNLMEKFKDYGYSWLEALPARLWDILRENPSEENLYALVGAFASLLSEKRLLTGEKDFTRRRREYDLVRSFLETPRSANLYMTTRCNFKCRYCYRQHHSLEDAPDLAEGTVAQLLRRYRTIRSACVCGLGEPLLASTLIPVLRLLKRERVRTSLITNGSLLARRLPEMDDCRPDQISVSVYGSRAELQAAYTQAGTFEATLA
jgi:sulfatase maturation enzyme AslB (radical SAM superfamily)